MICFSGGHSGGWGQGRKRQKLVRNCYSFLEAYLLDRENDYTPWEQLIEIRWYYISLNDRRVMVFELDFKIGVDRYKLRKGAFLGSVCVWGSEGRLKETKADNFEWVWHLPNTEETFCWIRGSFWRVAMDEHSLYVIVSCLCLAFVLSCQTLRRGSLPYVPIPCYFI